MKVFLACLLIVSVSAFNLEKLELTFQTFKLEHGKTYKSPAEETKRLSIFKDNLRAIEEHNSLYLQGLVSYKQGINQFADLTREEFTSTLTLRSANKPLFNITKHVKTELAIPDSVDWRIEGQVTEVKNQRVCAASWPFSITGSTEAAYFRESGELVSLSEQQLVDCSTDINEGCTSGYLDETFVYVQENGLQSEESYPFTATNDDCKYSASDVVTKISGYKSITDENALLDAVANVGPVSVAMDATFLAWYQCGIFTDNTCSPDDLNHAVLIVGYGSENGTDYWIVKNSWGPTFGEKGFFRILRGQNECGIAEDTVYPTV